MRKKSPFWLNLICFQILVLLVETACNMRDSQFAHLPPSDYFYKRYEGKMGEDLHFTMELNRHDSTLEGSYFYEKIGKPIDLSGKIDKSGRISLVESLEGKETGKFEGSFKAGNQEEIVGEWVAKGKKISFEMQENYQKGMAQLKMDNYSDSYGKCDLNEEKMQGCAKIRLNVLQIVENSSETIKNKVNEKLNLMAFEGKNPENITRDFIAQYQKDIKELSPEFTLVYEQNLDMKVLLNEKNILSIQCEKYEYMGGAHGSLNNTFANFDLGTGAEIAVESLFLPNSKQEISTIAEQSFRIKNNISEKQTFEEAGYWFADNKFYLPQKFYLLRDKIVFQYEEYEIAPYAMGAQIVEIPYTQIEKFLLKDSILANFLKP